MYIFIYISTLRDLEQARARASGERPTVLSRLSPTPTPTPIPTIATTNPARTMTISADNLTATSEPQVKPSMGGRGGDFINQPQVKPGLGGGGGDFKGVT